MSQDTVFSLAISPNFLHDGICFAAKRSGLYRSQDGGETWEYAYKSLTSNSIPTLAVCLSPSFDQDRLVFAGTEGGVLRSRDGGKTWEYQLLDSPPPLPIALAISPSFFDDGMLFVATLEDGVYCSNNYGLSWRPWNFGLFDLHTNCLGISPHFTKDRILYVGTESGLYISENGGKSWMEVSLGKLSGAVSHIAISPDYHEDSTILAVIDQSRICYSRNRGSSWISDENHTFSEAIRGLYYSFKEQRATKIVVLVSSEIWILDGFSLEGYVLHTLLQPATCLASFQDQQFHLLIGLENGQIQKERFT